MSYAREDRERAEIVARRLGEHGWSVWWDRQIAGGTQFDRATEEAIAAAKIVIVLWSRHAINSDWVRAEASWALDKKKLLPVTIDPVQPPLRFNLVQTLDLNIVSQNPTRSAGFETLISEVTRQLKVPSGRVRVQAAIDNVTSQIARDAATLRPAKPRQGMERPRQLNVESTQTQRLPIVMLAVVAICLVFGFGYMMMAGDIPIPAISKTLNPTRAQALDSSQVAARPQAPASSIILPPPPTELPPPLIQRH